MQLAMTRQDDQANVELGELNDLLGFLVRIAQIQTFDQFFEAFDMQDLRPGEVSSLLVIGHNPCIRQGLLAQTLRIKPAQMSKLIRSLDKRRLVERIIPEDDRRSVELRLTRKGESVLDHYRPMLNALDPVQRGKLSEDENRLLKSLLRKLVGLEPGREERKQD
ncbi:MarR family transcriptional regulator [Hoeflea sp. WL0058]|uniref:MarR family transcriptional regulator n=1 Tax=Flavimaribacter sediminis TaxID=2865987 RepID=A0AAE3D027_9HYPH|nr:MarR family transcriptional regulator [Flavimaribacter sediminis]MBW8637254.1 MarR family transcriptional regulator [Flavimaribacter sediminis]